MPHRSLRALVATALVALTLTAALPGRAESPCAGSFCWIQRGNYAGLEFTSLLSPPGNPCVIAWTALSNGGLGVSTDCGAQYANLFQASAYDVTARDSNVGYVAAGTLGIAKTKDTGSFWFAINDGLPPFPDARAILLHVAKPDSVFCGLHGGGVFIGGPKAGGGNDSLMAWTAINQGLGDLNVRALARVRGGTFMVAGCDGGIWRRGNNQWSLVGAGLVANAFVIDSADSNRVYAATESGVYRSLNQGLSWFPSSAGLPSNTPVNDVARRTENSAVLYIGTRGQGVWESTDYGANWRAFGPPLPGDNDVRSVLCAVGAVAADSANVFAGTRANGLFQNGYSTPAKPVTWGQVKSLYRR
ncbi:MAG: hypothetical protein ABI960_09060 [Candidatus Eisenbacteria bacterium]